MGKYIIITPYLSHLLGYVDSRVCWLIDNSLLGRLPYFSFIISLLARTCDRPCCGRRGPYNESYGRYDPGVPRGHVKNTSYDNGWWHRYTSIYNEKICTESFVRGSAGTVGLHNYIDTPTYPVVSLSKKLYPYCLVLVGSRNGFKHDFRIKLK